MEDFYGINRLELKNLTYNELQNFRIFKKALNENILESLRLAILKKIDKMKLNKSEYAGIVRYFDGI